MEIKDQNSLIQAIGFNLGNLANDYKIEDKINIAGTLEINNYNGRETIQINIRDVMKSL